jgi:hypothetical protein
MLRYASILTAAILLTTSSIDGGPRRASAQAAKPKPAAQPAAPKQTAAPATSAAPASAAEEDAIRKRAILDSPQWRRAMFEFKEWLSTQKLYDAAQVAQIKDNFNHKVARMSADEVQFMLQDMQAKFQILESPQAQEARAWMASYLSVMSDKKRAEVLKQMPNLATMTAGQLAQEIAKIEQKRTNIERQEAAFQSTRQAEVQQQFAQDRAMQQALARQPQMQSGSASYSPYRSSSQSINDRLNPSAMTGPHLGYYMNAWGGVGITFNPSSW